MNQHQVAPLDVKPYIEHDPLLGYRYVPHSDLELPRPGGGTYRIRVNADGIRSDREYARAKPAGVRRAIVCGDSMSAGQFVSNENRFTELMERRVPGLEIVNLSLEGSGTDQQVLLYEQLGRRFEHDFVVLMPFLQNIRRNMVDAREGIDPRTKARVLRGKPRYDLVGEELVLRNVPVPRDIVPGDSNSALKTDQGSGSGVRLKGWAGRLPGIAFAKKLVYGLLPWEPFPEYRDRDTTEWRLMAALVGRLASLAEGRPVVVAPTFYSSYVRFNMARHYWERYSELAATPGIHAVDLLPHFRALGGDALSCFQEPHDPHFSVYGNFVLANALQQELVRLGLLEG